MRCGATFSCAMADDGLPDHQPCWCTALPPVVPVPGSVTEGASCWCPECLRAHISATSKDKSSPPPAAPD
jgi:hypothetical protein